MNNGNIIDQYYQGIYQQLHAEVTFINTLFQHQGVKGEGNELVLRELLTKFIPKRYGVGTGVVIDSLGHQSKQCDIVIYDTFWYPSLLSLASVHLFPVDIVYATIEVKTTLTKEEADEALLNIASVKELQLVQDQWLTPIEGIHHTIKFQKPMPPIGFIFAYNSHAKRFETFKDWFVPRDDNKIASYPTAVCCLDQGIVSFNNLYPQPGEQPQGQAYPLHTFSREGTLDSVPIGTPSYVDPRTLSEREKKLYPVKTVKATPRDNRTEQYKTTLPIDPSRVLLNFILLLSESLSHRQLNPNLSFREHYVAFYTKSYLPQ